MGKVQGEFDMVSKNIRKHAVALLALALFTTYASGQNAPAHEAATPTIVTNADEVTLDLIAHDKKNNPVLDLKSSDITITDSGADVKLTDLRLISGQPGADHLISLVFDQLDASAAKNARDVAAKILKIIPASGFSFSVLNVDGRLRLFQEFTVDRTAITRAVSAATARSLEDKPQDDASPEKELISVAQTGADSSGTRVSASDRNIAQVMLYGLQDSQRIMQDQHAQPCLAGLLALAHAQRRIRGRKVVIFFAQGLKTDANATDMLRSITVAANRAGLSIYVIDKDAVDQKAMAGLLQTAAIGGATSFNAQNPAPTGPGTPHGAYGPGMITEIGEQYGRFENDGLSGHKDPLTQLAIDTGGAHLMSEDGLKKPLHQVIADMTSYYEASYVPPNQNYDGQFRPVAVKPLRKGLKMQSRSGYFALPPDSGMGIRPFEAPLLKILAEPQFPQDVKFRVRVLRLGDMPSGNENALVVEVPESQLETRDDPNSNLYSLHISIVAQIRNKAGEVVEHFSEDVPRHGALDSKGTARAEFVSMQRHFLEGPGEYTVEAAILDRNSGKAGAQRAEFEIHNPMAGPSLGDIALVQRMDPLPEDADATEPLRYGNEKVIASISDQISHGAKAVSFFFLIHPDPDSAEQPRLEMEVLRNGEPISQSPMQLRKTSGPASIPYMASIQTKSLSGGEYEIIERLTQGGNSAERSLAFHVEGTELASAGTGVPNTPDSEPESLANSGIAPPQIDHDSGNKLVITALPPGTVATPSADELQAIIDSARKRALEYAKTLPNFVCVEVTNRSEDSTGNGNWKPRDSIAELLRYHDNEESRTTLEVNGKRSSLKRADMNSTWPLSVGEFGGLLNLVFQPSSKTDFEWKEADTLGGGTVHVLTYRVLPKNATLSLNEGNHTIGVGFHGLLYIDAATGGVHRITLEADDLPRTFSIHAASMSVEYDYTAIGSRDYLLPVRSTVSLHRHRKGTELNEIAFRNYRRFGSRTRIKLVQ
jgi:VWFA-related protein